MTSSNAVGDLLVRVRGQLRLLFDLVKIHVGHLGFVSVDDLGHLLECGAAGLDVHKVDKAQFEEDPALGRRQVSRCVACSGN